MVPEKATNLKEEKSKMDKEQIIKDLDSCLVKDFEF